MLAHLLVRNPLCLMLVIAALAAGDALAGHGGRGGHGGGGGGDHGGGHSRSGGGGGGSSWSGGGGGGGGSSFSMRSSRGGGGGGGGSSMKSWSGGSNNWSGGSKSWSGGSKSWSGGSSSLPSANSFRSMNGGSGKSAWSGGDSNRGRSFAGQNWSAGKGSNGNSQNAAKQFGNFSGGNFGGKTFSGNMQAGDGASGNAFSGKKWSGQSSDAARQFRAYRGQPNNGSNSGIAGGNSTHGGNNDQLQQMFKKYHEQQASATSDAKSFDRSRSSNWSKALNQANGFKADKGLADAGDTNRFRGNTGKGQQTWSGKPNGQQLSGDLKSLPHGNKFNGGGDFKGDKGPGQFGKWSQKDGNQLNSQTAHRFGNSGFGDHRGNGRGDWSQGDFGHGGKNWGGGKSNHGDWNGKGGKWDGDNHWGGDKWGDHVRNEWNKNWSNKHGHHDSDWYRGRGWRDVPFAYGWWGGRRDFGYCYYWNGWRSDPWYWWAPCTAPLLTAWVDFGWNYPCYWDYGPNQYVTYYNEAVYVDGQRYATELDYYAQVRNLARSVPTLTPDQLAAIEWLPLGVFAVTRAGEPQANELVQLAVSKDGILSGTWFDQRTGQARPLQGRVEQATQRAAWCFADSATDALVVETSLYNLTESQCSALAHLDAVSTEVWQLVRLQQPAGAQPPPAAAPAGQVNAPAAQPMLPPQGEVK